jgi:hypothetical protein
MAIFITTIFLSPIDGAYAAAPSAGTGAVWTNGSYFDAYSSRSGVTTSDLSPTNDLVWQLYYANAPLTITADANTRVGFNTYQSGSNSWSYRIAISTVDDTLGSFGAETQFATGGTTYTAGGFNANAVFTTVTIPARRYFIIGVHTGAYYRTFKTSLTNRSAQISGLTYVTAINTIYYAPHSNSVFSGIPTALGGSSTAFTTYTGYVAMYSIAFTATGTPSAPSLTTPDTPSVNSTFDTSAIFSETSIVANSQSYIASLYQSNGTTLIETRTVTNAQVISGFTWTGLTPNTSYKVGMTAVGDQTTYSNSALSGLQSFTTTKTQTSLGLTFSGQTATFNTPITITATISGSTSGKITFFSNGKRISKCVSKVVSTSTVTCTWEPLNRGLAYISATFVPTSSSQLGSSTSASMVILNRSNNR